jgi:amino acid permease
MEHQIGDDKGKILAKGGRRSKLNIMCSEISQNDKGINSDAEYGKVGVVEDNSYAPGLHETVGLKRSLNARHTAMITIASGIGTGLFLGSGSALYSAGPLGILLGYFIMGLVAAGVSFISAETIGYLPVSGGFVRFVPLFSDKALGITIGYTFWYLLSITAPAEVVAASSLIGCKYFSMTEEVPFIDIFV